MNHFVCAFRGRRDSYQVPLALAEAGSLDELITDAYATAVPRIVARGLPGSIRDKLNSRFVDGIPVERIRCLWGTTLLEHARHAVGCAPMLTYNKLDQHFSRAAAHRAEQMKSDLFLYSPYAWEAFTARYSHTPRKVLFQYHPHSEMERRILAEDSVQYPGVGESFSGTKFGPLKESLAHRERDAWKHADLIFCASTFTKQSLLEAGCDERRCRVVPYGVDLPAEVPQAPPSDFHALFVGSGGQRKGLHHLLLAWQRAALPPTRKLTLVCRVIDKGIEKMLAATPHVELRREVSQNDLERLYANSSLFVMPSLLEGFGQVYLEALARGCPVLGTPDTALPDLGKEADGIFLVSSREVDGLADRLASLARFLPNNQAVRAAAHAVARKFSWRAFRRVLLECLNGQ